jgi:hypothetical protein
MRDRIADQAITRVGRPRTIAMSRRMKVKGGRAFSGSIRVTDWLRGGVGGRQIASGELDLRGDDDWAIRGRNLRVAARCRVLGVAWRR